MIGKIEANGLAAGHEVNGLRPGLYLHWLQGRFGRKYMDVDTELGSLLSYIKEAGRPLMLNFNSKQIPKEGDDEVDDLEEWSPELEETKKKHARAESDTLFAKLDRDGDGTLTRKEIKKGLKDLQAGSGLNFQGKKAKQIFMCIDDDGGGQVDADEFFYFIQSAPERAASDKLFKQLDRGNDGFLSRKEIKKGLELFNTESGIAGDAKQIFSSADMNDGGAIDKNEFFKFVMANKTGDTYDAHRAHKAHMETTLIEGEEIPTSFTFVGKKAIGIIFIEKEEGICVGAILHGGQANREFSEYIQPGMVLIAVEGHHGRRDTEFQTAKDVARMIEHAGKPCVLHFEPGFIIETRHVLLSPWTELMKGVDEHATRLRVGQLIGLNNQTYNQI